MKEKKPGGDVVKALADEYSRIASILEKHAEDLSDTSTAKRDAILQEAENLRQKVVALYKLRDRVQAYYPDF